jgi:hypothetical protein
MFVRLLLVLVLASFFAPFAFAADELTQPGDREGRISLLNTRRAVATMKPSEGQSPKGIRPLLGVSTYTGTGTGGVRPGDSTGTFDADGFSRFMQIGLNQSYDKTYQEGWTILHNVVKRALTDVGPLPDGVRLALTSGRDASYEKSWKDAYTILHEAAKTVTGNPAEFAAGGPTLFAAYLRLARQSAYDKSYEVGWKVLEKYLDNLARRENLNGRNPSFYPSRELKLLLDAARAASYSKAWKPAYEVQHVSIKRAETRPSGDLKGFYYDNALECSFEKTYQEGYEILRTFIEKGLASGLINSFDCASLKATLQASHNQTWQTGYEVLRDGLKGLRL